VAEAAATAAAGAAATAAAAEPVAAEPSPPPAAEPGAGYAAVLAAADFVKGQPVRVLWTAGDGDSSHSVHADVETDADGGTWLRGTVRAATAGVRALVIDFERYYRPLRRFVEFGKQGTAWKVAGPVPSPPPSPRHRYSNIARKSTACSRPRQYCQVCQGEIDRSGDDPRSLGGLMTCGLCECEGAASRASRASQRARRCPPLHGG